MSLFRYILLFITCFASIGNSKPFDIEVFLKNDVNERNLVILETAEYTYAETTEEPALEFDEYTTHEPSLTDYPYSVTEYQGTATERVTEQADEKKSSEEDSDPIINTDPAMGGAFGGIFGVLALLAIIRHACFKKTMAEMESEKAENTASPGVEMEEIQVDGGEGVQQKL